MLAALAVATPAISQESGLAPGSQVSPEDSAAIVDAGRSDQSAFERFRRSRLEYTWGGGSARCDERIGRFCITHSTGGSAWIVPREDDEVIAARLSLVEGLGMAAELIPGDRWIAGQRVRYLIEAKMYDEAAVAAAACRAEAWWCEALAGYAFHYSALPAAADSAFDRALAAMDDERRETWTDLSLILDDRSVRVYRRLEGDERADFERRFWRLSDPLLARPGNEIRGEHLSRHVWNELQDRAASPEVISWGWDLREILIRYGWPTGWEQTRGFSQTLEGRPPLVSHYASAPIRLLPPAAALLDENGAIGTWDAEEGRVRASYDIPLADSIPRWFDPLSHQVAVFPRGETAFIAAAYELPADSIAEGAVVEAILALLPTGDPDLESLSAPSGSRGAIGAMLLETPAIPGMVAIEVLVPSERRIGRARYGIDLKPTPRDLVSLSDLLLLRSDTELPDSLAAAIPLARGSARVTPGEQLGIFWEAYGVDPAVTPVMTMSLRLLRPRVGWLRRLGERAGILRDSDAIRLRWDEPVTAGPLLSRSIHIAVPDVSPGTYAIELAVEIPGREALTVRREIEVGGN